MVTSPVNPSWWMAAWFAVYERRWTNRKIVIYSEYIEQNAMNKTNRIPYPERLRDWPYDARQPVRMHEVLIPAMSPPGTAVRY